VGTGFAKKDMLKYENKRRQTMGLLDILNGMQNGPRGQRQPSSGGKGGGMSPMMMALLALLAYKAFKGSGNRAHAPGTGQPAPLPPGTVSAGNPGGGLGDILGGLLGGRAGAAPGGASPGGLSDLMKGGLGGLLGGAAAGSVLSGGLGNLVKELQARGHGNVAQSWIGTGKNREIAPSDLEHALGSDTLDTLAQQTGMSRAELLAGLSEHLPDLVDQLTPDGRLPTEQEAARMV
jgi:uncharacterized protein YidB (DUF937 family)